MQYSGALLLCAICWCGITRSVSANSASDEAILNWEAPKELKAKFPYSLLGYDYDDNPVWFAEFGKWDVLSVIQHGKKNTDDLDRLFDQCFLRLLEYADNSTSDNDDPGSLAIFDMEGFSLKQVTNPLSLHFLHRQVKKFSKLFRNGRFKLIIFINVNHVFQTFWNWTKPFLSAVINNFELHGPNAAKWKPRLLRKIPADQLPPFLGGSNHHKPIRVFP